MSGLRKKKSEECFSGTATEGFERWKTSVGRIFPPLYISPTGKDSFSGSIKAGGVEGLHMSMISSSPHLVERRPDLIARSSQGYLKLSVHVRGQSRLILDGREVVLRPGDVALYDTSRPYTLVQEQDYSMIVAMFPPTAVRALAPDAPLLNGLKLNADSGLTSIVSDYLLTLTRNLASLTGPAGQRLAQSGLDLIGSLLANELNTIPATEPHALSLQRIKAFIDRNLDDPGLSPGVIAAANFISVRHLHDLFHKDGKTVAAWVRSQRLEHCRRDLADPLLAGRSVSNIAASWGFLDAGHFAKLFRNNFGQTPTQYRMAAARCGPVGG